MSTYTSGNSTFLTRNIIFKKMVHFQGKLVYSMENSQQTTTLTRSQAWVSRDAMPSCPMVSRHIQYGRQFSFRAAFAAFSPAAWTSDPSDALNKVWFPVKEMYSNSLLVQFYKKNKNNTTATTTTTDPNHDNNSDHESNKKGEALHFQIWLTAML